MIGRAGAAGALLAVGIGLGSAACGTSGPPKIYGPDFLDRAGIEQSIRTEVTTQFGMEVDAVQCPIRQVVDGDSFDCGVVIAGEEVRIKVTQTDGEGSVSIVQDQAVLRTPAVVAVVTRTLGENGLTPAQVDCGGAAIVVRDVGGTTDCLVTFADGTRRRAIVTFQDVQGAVTIRLASA